MRALALSIGVLGLVCSGALWADSSQDDTVNITLKIPPELASSQATNNIAIDRLNTANEEVQKIGSPPCADCLLTKTGSDTSLDLMFGTGKTFAQIPSQSGNEEWRDIDLRLSHALGDGCYRVDSGLLNLGHDRQTNVYHDQDGAYLQLTCSKQVLKNLTAEVGIGGYLSMDTTTPIGKTEEDQKGLNVLATIALKYYIGKSGLHLRLECNAVAATGILTKGPNSVSCLAGVGDDFSKPTSSPDFGVDGKNAYSIDSGPIMMKTNQAGTKSTVGTQVTFSRYVDNWVGRIGILATGDDDNVNNDQGAELLVQRKFPIGDSGKNTLYSGAGIYLARNLKASTGNQVEFNVMLTFLGYEHDFGHHLYVRAEYDRMARDNNAEVSGQEGSDADVVQFAAGYRW